jgi:hypothetical protein
VTRGVGGASYTTHAIQICGSCLMWEANGCDDNDPTDGASYVAGVERLTRNGGHVSLGSTREEYARRGVDPREEGADDLGFSHAACEICQERHAAGDRYAATLWLPRLWERDERGRFVSAWTVGACFDARRDCPPGCLGCSRGTSKSDPRTCRWSDDRTSGDAPFDLYAERDERAHVRADHARAQARDE